MLAIRRKGVSYISKASHCINKIFKKMETRSTPHTTADLHSLAKEAHIPNYEKLSKPALLTKLKDAGGLKRLQRVVQRRNNTKAANGSSALDVQKLIEHVPMAAPVRQFTTRARKDTNKRKAEEEGEEGEEEGEAEEVPLELQPTIEKGKGMKSKKKNTEGSSNSKMTPTTKKRKKKRAQQQSGKKIDDEKKKKTTLTLNELDPIMLTPILKKHVFHFVRPNGTVIQFNIESLVDFMLASGDFNDPETRIPFTDEDLKAIDTMAKNAGLADKGSVFAAKHNVSAQADAKFRRDALLALERCAGESVTEMLNVVERYHPDDAEMHLVMREFPTFADYFSQMRSADQDYATKFISSQILFMKGPPNRPNRDPYGLISTVCGFLINCKAGLMP